MHITGIGINADGSHLNGSLEQLAKDLTFFRRCGFNAVELSAHGLDVIVGGMINRPQVDRVCTIVERFDFTYTVHAPDQINLAFPQGGPNGRPGLDYEKEIFIASLDFCAAVGAGIMVYHSGLIALHEAAFGLAPLPDDEALQRAREQEVSALRELAPLAAERGVIVAMENRDPHPWEIATLRRAGLPEEQLLKYHAGMSIVDLVGQVEAVNHPNMGLTVDLGHLFLAANQCGFDFLGALRQAAPFVHHLHISGNFGRLGGVFDSLNARIPYGDGDVHLPPSWGTIPHREALTQLPTYEGIYLLEIRSRFYEHFAEEIDIAQQMFRQAEVSYKSLHG